MENKPYYIENLTRDHLPHLADFVVMQNIKSHAGEIKALPEHSKLVQMIYDEECCYYKNSKIYTAFDNTGGLLGIIRTMKWDYNMILPIQRIFGISPLTYAKQYQKDEIWHIGRFAIKKGVRQIRLLKHLMILAIHHICTNDNGMALAECDSKLLQSFGLMGIGYTILGKPINYLGSETMPICMTGEDLQHFYIKNKGLLDERNESLEFNQFTQHEL